MEPGWEFPGASVLVAPTSLLDENRTYYKNERLLVLQCYTWDSDT
jgi:hypothetical protein